jgi:hypothetical protein
MTLPVHREGRQRRLAAFLRVAGGLVLACSLAGMALPAPERRVPAGVMVVTLVSAPAVRALWLARRWNGKGDRRYALVALAVVAIIAVGAALGS